MKIESTWRRWATRGRSWYAFDPDVMRKIFSLSMDWMKVTHWSRSVWKATKSLMERSFCLVRSVSSQDPMFGSNQINVVLSLFVLSAFSDGGSGFAAVLDGLIDPAAFVIICWTKLVIRWIVRGNGRRYPSIEIPDVFLFFCLRLIDDFSWFFSLHWSVKA